MTTVIDHHVDQLVDSLKALEALMMQPESLQYLEHHPPPRRRRATDTDHDPPVPGIAWSEDYQAGAEKIPRVRRPTEPDNHRPAVIRHRRWVQGRPRPGRQHSVRVSAARTWQGTTCPLPSILHSQLLVIFSTSQTGVSHPSGTGSPKSSISTRTASSGQSRTTAAV